MTDRPPEEAAGETPPPDKEARRGDAPTGMPEDSPTPDDTLGEFDGVDWELVRRCAEEPETDIANGRRFLYRFGEDVFFLPRVGWHAFNGAYWVEDRPEVKIDPMLHEAAEAIALEPGCVPIFGNEKAAIEAMEASQAVLLRLEDADGENAAIKAEKKAHEQTITAGLKAVKAISDRRKSRARFAKTSAGVSRINAMRETAKPYVAKDARDLNPDPLVLNCLNGTLRFESAEDLDCPDPDATRHIWEARLCPHERKDLITKCAAVDYRPGQDTPRFDAFLERVQPDPEIRSFLQRMVGYCLTGYDREQVIFFLYGFGKNGKSTFIDLIARIIDGYAVTLPIETLTGEERRKGSDATPDLARLPGARLVRSAEPEEGTRLKESMVKTLTSSEPIPIRHLHEDFTEIYPDFKLVISGNHKPVVIGGDEGIWRRIILIDWPVQIPKTERDLDLPEKLWVERQGVFAWCVEGVKAYLAQGLDPPAAVLESTAEYRRESDPIGAFVKAACVVSGEPSHTETPGTLYDAYATFARSSGEPEMKQTTFARKFASATRRMWEGDDGKLHQFSKSKSGSTIYRGLFLKSQFTRTRKDDDDE